MKKSSKTMAIILMAAIMISVLVPIKAKADSTYPNVVTTYIGYELSSTVDVNFHAGSIEGLIGTSPLADFRTAVGLTEEDIENYYHPVVYTKESTFGDEIADQLRSKATELGAEQVVTFIDILLFKQTTESTLVSSYPNYVTYTIKLPSSLDSSEMEYAMISHYDGKMRMFKDQDEDYTTLTFSTNISSPYALVRAWDGTFDNIEDGAYVDGTVETTTVTTDDSELDDVPKTGQSNVIIFFGIAAIVSGGCYLYLKKEEQLV